MIILERFRAEHFKELKEEPSVAYLLPHLTAEHLERLEKIPFAFTGKENGRVVFCAGLSEYWADRAEAWAIFNGSIGHNFIPIHRMVKKFLQKCPVRRVEAAVEIDFIEGHRWVKMLGFKREAAFMEAYLPNGKDCTLYSMVRH